jgi:MFS family permease
VSTLAVLYLGNAATWIGQGSIDVSLPAIVADVSMDFDQTSAARLLTAGTLGYTVAKFCVGLPLAALGDRATWVAALATAAIALAAGGAFASAEVPLLAAVFVAKLGFGCSWPCLQSLLGRTFRGTPIFSSALGIVSTSSRVGKVVGNTAAALALSWLGPRAGWRVVLAIGGAGCGAQALALRWAGARPTSGPRSRRDGTVKTSSKPPASTIPMGEALPRLLFHARDAPRLWLCFLMSFCVLPAYGLGSVLPTFLVEEAKWTVADAGLVCAAWPAGMAIVLPLAGWSIDRLPRKVSSLLTVALLAACAAGLFALTAADLTAPRDPRDAAAMSALRFRVGAALLGMGFAYAPAVYFPQSTFAATYGGKEFTGLLASLLDAPGCLASMVFFAAMPAMQRAGGWTLVWQVMSRGLCGGVATVAALLWWEDVAPARAFNADEDGTGARKKRA